MPYDIATMRARLQQYIAPLFAPGATGVGIGESFASMQASDGRLAEQTPASCLIPRDDGNGHAVVDCNLNTASSHAIQETVLRRIATTNQGGQEVLDFHEHPHGTVSHRVSRARRRDVAQKTMGHRKIVAPTSDN